MKPKVYRPILSQRELVRKALENTQADKIRALEQRIERLEAALLNPERNLVSYLEGM